MADGRVIKRTRGAVLVEHAAGRQRTIVPAAAVQDERIDGAALETGIPYGAPWSELVQLSATPQAVEDALRRRGIWTVADLRRNLNAARAALQDVYGLDLAALLRAAARYEQGGSDGH